MGKDAVDEVQFGGCHQFLRLHDLDAVGHARLEPLPREVQDLTRHGDVALRQVHLTGRSRQVQDGPADVRLDLARQVLEFGLPLCHDRLGL